MNPEERGLSGGNGMTTVCMRLSQNAVYRDLIERLSHHSKPRLDSDQASPCLSKGSVSLVGISAEKRMRNRQYGSQNKYLLNVVSTNNSGSIDLLSTAASG